MTYIEHEDRKSKAAGEVADVDAVNDLPKHKVSDIHYDEAVPPEYHGAEITTSVLAAMREAREHQSRTLMLIGAPGTGKTFQVWGAYRRIMRNIYASTNGPRTLLDKYGKDYLRGSLKVISEAEDIEQHRYDQPYIANLIAHDGWLAVDDIGYAKTASEWSLMAVYNIANARRRAQRPTIWTTNLDLDKIGAYYSPAVASRLTGGITLHLMGEDKRA